MTGQQGEVKGRYDYQPFGEEFSVGRAGYGGGGVRQKFTQKERDDEIGLDFFGASYYKFEIDEWRASLDIEGSVPVKN